MEEDGFKLVKSKKSSKKNKKSSKKVVPVERIDEILSPEEILQHVKYVSIKFEFKIKYSPTFSIT